MAYISNKTVNCESNIVNGDYEPQTLTITVTCSPEYEFQVIPVIQWERWSSSGRIFSGEYPMEKVNDCTFTYDLEVINGPDYCIAAEAVHKTVVLDKYGLITVYRVTTDELKDISSKRFITISGTGSSANIQYIDTAQYVVSVHKLYVSLTSELKEKLYFGPYDMGLECDVIGNDLITLDLGSVDIPETYGNSIDYNDTEIQIYLPFIGFVSLPPSDYMNHNVTLRYQINVINGDALAILICDGNVMYSQSCNVAFKIPYQLKGSEFVETTVQPNTNYLLDTPACIYVKTHNAVDQNTNLPYHDTKFYSKFGDLSGYTEATEIDLKILSSHITKPEIEEIRQLLESGVFL